MAAREEIVSYVQETLQNGFSPPQIRDHLRQAGFAQTDIHDSMLAAMNPDAPRYAGFWVRLLGGLIDTAILIGAGAILAGIIGAISGTTSVTQAIIGLSDPTAMISIVTYASIIVGSFLYFTLLQSSRHQSTLGESALGLRVTDELGQTLTYERATLRFFGMLLSTALLMLGHVAALLFDRNQALHDHIARTVVVHF